MAVQVIASAYSDAPSVDVSFLAKFLKEGVQP